jgi:hypothetical protein
VEPATVVALVAVLPGIIILPGPPPFELTTAGVANELIPSVIEPIIPADNPTVAFTYDKVSL